MTKTVTFPIEELSPLPWFLEDALQVQFRPSDLLFYDLDITTALRLREATSRYEQQFWSGMTINPDGSAVYSSDTKRRLPELKSDKTRLHFFPQSRSVEVTDTRTWRVNQASTIRSADQVNDRIKRALLFADSIFVEEPPFVGAVPQSPTMIELLEAQKRSLIHYSQFNDLMLQKIIVPIPMRVFNWGDFDGNKFLIPYGDIVLAEQDEIFLESVREKASLLLDCSSEEMTELIAKAMVLQVEQIANQNASMPLVEDMKIARVLAVLLPALKSANSQEINQPILTAQLTGNANIDPAGVSWADLLTIRRDDEVFAAWRDSCSSILQQLVHGIEIGADSQRELTLAATEQSRVLGEKLGTLQATPFWRNFQFNPRTIASTFSIGLLTSAVFGGVLPTVGAALVDTLVGSYRAGLDGETRSALRSHIQAFGAPIS